MLTASTCCHVARGDKDENTGPAMDMVESWAAVAEAAAAEKEVGTRPSLIAADVIDFKLVGKIEPAPCL